MFTRWWYSGGSAMRRRTHRRCEALGMFAYLRRDQRRCKVPGALHARRREGRRVGKRERERWDETGNGEKGTNCLRDIRKRVVTPPTSHVVAARANPRNKSR